MTAAVVVVVAVAADVDALVAVVNRKLAKVKAIRQSQEELRSFFGRSKWSRCNEFVIAVCW